MQVSGNLFEDLIAEAERERHSGIPGGRGMEGRMEEGVGAIERSIYALLGVRCELRSERTGKIRFCAVVILLANEIKVGGLS